MSEPLFNISCIFFPVQYVEAQSKFLHFLFITELIVWRITLVSFKTLRAPKKKKTSQNTDYIDQKVRKITPPTTTKAINKLKAP